MLSAILNGKGRRLPEGLPSGAPLRMAFRRSEDILTATVFERLAYFDGPVLWRILEATFQPKVLSRQLVVMLDRIEFWPTWGQAKETLGKAVEPDVVMRLTVGDPPVKVALIVECKLDGFQYPKQWAQEWIAYRATQAEDSEQPEEVYLLALGGLTKGPATTVAEFTAECSRDHSIAIKAAAAGWQDLHKALDDVKITGTINRRIAADITAALDLYGFRRFRSMQDLARAVASNGGVSERYPALRWDTDKNVALDEPRNELADFAKKTIAVRPVQEHRSLRWSDDNV